VIYAGTKWYSYNVPLEKMRAWEVAMLLYMRSSYGEIGRDIAEKKRISDETAQKLSAALDTFMKTWS
jgi:F-type H+-transporting ATPase subunit alpha